MVCFLDRLDFESGRNFCAAGNSEIQRQCLQLSYRTGRATNDPAANARHWPAKEQILARRIRTKYTDRNKEYSLRDSEIHALEEVGKFRVVAVNDLAEFAYNADRSRTENEVESLARQGLMRQTTIAHAELNPTHVATLTKEARKLPT